MLFVYVLIIAFGLLTSIEDLKTGKIRNLHVGMMLAFGVVLGLASPDISSFAVNFAFSAFVAFVLWFVNLWAAGDAKLFMAYAAMIPLSVYAYGRIPIFPAYSLLLNTVAPAFFVLVPYLLIKTTSSQKKEVFKRMLEPRLVASIAAFIFSFSWLVGIFFSYFGLPQNYFLTIIFLFILLEVLERILPFGTLRLSLTVGILRLFFEFKEIFAVPFLANFLLMLAGFLVLRFFVLYLGIYVFSTPVEIPNLKAGMIPLEGIRKEKGRYEKINLVDISLFNLLRQKKIKFLFDNRPTGLTKEDVELLNEMYRKGELKFSQLLIQQTIPFAPLLFLGALLTLLFKGNLFIYLQSLI